MDLPLAAYWYDSEYLGNGITWIDERFFVGDSLLDGAQVYAGEPPEYSDDADPEAFRRSYERLLSLAITNVYPGHGSPFDAQRMRTIITDYLA